MSDPDTYVITTGDVGKRHLNAFGTTWRVLHIPGLGIVITEADVGRTVHHTIADSGDQVLNVT